MTPTFKLRMKLLGAGCLCVPAGGKGAAPVAAAARSNNASIAGNHPLSRDTRYGVLYVAHSTNTAHTQQDNGQYTHVATPP